MAPYPAGARSLFAHAPFWSGRAGPHGCITAADFTAAGAAIPNDPVLRRGAFNRCSSLDTAADSKTTDAARDPGSRQRGHREGADKEGTLAAIKAPWRELADPRIKEHHGPVVKTTRLAAIESRKGRLSSSVAPKRSGPSGPRRWHLFQPGYPGFWGQRSPTYCIADGQVMIEAGRVLAGLQKTAFTALAYA